MDNTSQRTLRRIELNDNKLTQIYLAGISSPGYAEFSSCSSGDYSRLGRAIAKNAQLVELKIDISNSNYGQLETTNKQFYDGLKRNTSIKKLDINCRNHNIVDRVGHELLKAYQENGNQLTYLRIKDASLQYGGDQVIALTLQRCPTLNTLILNECRIDTNYLTSIVEAVRGHSSLENLELRFNNISGEDCSILATLLNDPNCNLHTLDIEDNNIGNQGATILANSLANNTKLRKLNLQYNEIFLDCAQRVFSKILCNTTSIGNTYSSNHTLEHVLDRPGEELRSLFKLNKCTNKRHAAIVKILTYHHIDMELLYNWDSDGDWSLKALPHVIGWFEQAAEIDGGVVNWYHVDVRKLSAIYQFVHDMPLLFTPSYHNKKQKRDPDADK